MRMLILLISLTLAINVFGQENLDTIRYSTTRGDLKFYKKKAELKFLEMSRIVATNPDANVYLKKAKFNRDMNGICLGIGIISLSYGVLFGLAEAIENKESSQALSGFIAGTLVGGAFIALSIPSGKSYKANARKAIDIYNRDLQAPATSKSSLNLGLSQYGLTLSLRF